LSLLQRGGPSTAASPHPQPMQIADILTPERIACDVDVSSKKRALEKISELIAAADPSLTSGEVFDCLISRERLGSTCIGSGVAIPHGRVTHGERTLAAFMKMREGIDFEAIDRQPVDLVFAMMVPEHSTDEHLEILAQLADVFSDRAFRERLRQCRDGEEAFALITTAPVGT
jgi:PTS system nitrogen regulatory IIA component